MGTRTPSANVSPRRSTVISSSLSGLTTTARSAASMSRVLLCSGAWEGSWVTVMVTSSERVLPTASNTVNTGR